MKYWNAHGGFGGRKLTLTSIGDNGDPTVAVNSLVQYLGSHSKRDFVYAGTAGNETAALLPFLSRDHLLGASTTDGGYLCGSNAKKECPTAFALVDPAKIPAALVAQFFKKKGIKKVGILFGLIR